MKIKQNKEAAFSGLILQWKSQLYDAITKLLNIPKNKTDKYEYKLPNIIVLQTEIDKKDVPDGNQDGL